MALVRTKENTMAGTTDNGFPCSGGLLGRTDTDNQNAQSFRWKPFCYISTNRASFSASASCYWLLPALLPSSACCYCCLALSVDGPTHIAGPHSRYAKHTAVAKGRLKPIFICFFLLLLLCCCTHVALEALYRSHSRYNRSRAVSSLLFDSHGLWLCVYG